MIRSARALARRWWPCVPQIVAGLGPRRSRRAADGRACRRSSRGWGPADRGAPL